MGDPILDGLVVLAAVTAAVVLLVMVWHFFR